MNLPFTRDPVYLSPAFDVLQMPVPPRRDGRTDLPRDAASCDNPPSVMLSFLFDSVPFLPDFRLTKLRYADPFAPIVRSEFFLRDLLYSMECFVAPEDPASGGVMHLKFSIRNLGVEDYEATVRLHPGKVDTGTFTGSYWIFSRDNEKVPLEDDSMPFKDDCFYDGNRKSAMVYGTDGWQSEYEKEIHYAPALFNQVHYGTHHHFFLVQKQHRVEHAKNLLRLSCTLKPNEEKEFFILFDSSGKGIPAEATRDYSAARKTCSHFYEKLVSRPGVCFEFGNTERNELCRHNILHTLQLLRDAGLEDGKLTPLQAYGCFHSVWAFETMCMMEGMLPFGFFEETRKVLELLLGFQDAGCPPKGNFTTVSGAIGNPGPRWANSTGSILHLASLYLAYSGDLAFWHKYRQGLRRAAEWILGEVAATEKMTGKVYCGMLPPSTASDEDAGCFFCSSDNVSLKGLRTFLELPFVQEEKEYDSIRTGYHHYLTNVRRTVESLQRPDGFIPRQLPAAAEESEGVHFKKFDTLAGATRLFITDVLPYDGKVYASLVRYFEENEYKEFWTGPMDRDCIYIGFSDTLAYQYYLQKGEWKKAWGILQYLLNYGKSADLDLTVERISLSEPAFAPLQANASANGRNLKLLVLSLYCEYHTPDGVPALILLGGVSPFEYADSPDRSLSVFTRSGHVSLSAAGGRLELRRERPFPKGMRLRLPEHFRFEPSGETAESLLSPLANNWILQKETGCIKGRIALETSRQ